MSLVISEDFLETAHTSVEELKQEIAVLLFQKDRLTLAQAARFAGLPRLRFQHLLAGRGISPHYGIPEFEQDVATLKKLGLSEAACDIEPKYKMFT